ncbi:MAG: preprotein translocase subunit SecE [Lachnospiraceae bacterium]|nr:preprotein translocase subunit SecE [Lachnospiraceae bacterium]
MGNSNKAEKPSFSKGVQSEFKKISWPDKTSLLKQSVAVICVSVVLGVVIAVLDMLLQYGVNFLTM